MSIQGELPRDALARRDEIVRDAVAQLSPARITYRTRALAEAKALIEAKLGAFGEADLRLLLQIYNRDLVDGRELGNRFMTGMVGQNANLLVGSLANVNTVLPQLWAADDAWIREHLGGLRDGGTLPGGGWLFLSMVLHTENPKRRYPMTTKMVQGLPVLDLQPVARARSGADYLRYCERVRAVLRGNGVSALGADTLLFTAYRRKRALSAGTDATDEDDDAPEAENPSGHALGAAQAINAATVSMPTALLGSSGFRVGSPVAGGVREILVSSSGPFIGSRSDIPASLVEAVPNPAVPERRGSIGWLHLTDLHQGMDGTSWLWPNVAAKVFDDLARMHEVSGPWDLVFFTGDLTQKGQAEEFKRLDETLDRLWRHLDRLGSRPRLIAVPGNHDLERLDAVKDPVALALMQWHDNRKLQEYVVGGEKNPYLARMWEAFGNFTRWSERPAPWFTGEAVSRGLMPGDMSLSLPLHGLQLGIVGLNSAFLQLTDANFQERLHLHPQQLHAVCGPYAPEWLQKNHVNLLLTHHPPEWLEPRARQEFRNEIDVAGRFAGHFFGHMHEGTVTSIAMGGGQARHPIQGASLFGLENYDTAGRKAERTHGYSAGRIEAVYGEGGVVTHARMRMFPRRMFETPGGRRIDRDIGFELDERGSLSYEVPVKRRG